MGIYQNKIFFFALLTSIFLAEGLGLLTNRIPILFLITASSLILFFLLIITKRGSLKFPKLPVIFFSLFILTSLISVIKSENQINSLNQVFFYLSCLLFFLFINNYEGIKNQILNWLIFAGVGLGIYSVLLLVFGRGIWIPQTGYQLVFSRFGSHNHLADFLTMPILIGLVFLLTKRKKWLYGGLLFFLIPLFLFSYSRSAYTSMGTGLCLVAAFFYRRLSPFFKKILVIIITVLLLTLTFFFVVSVGEADQVPFLRSSHQFLISSTDLQTKYFRGRRLEFFDQAIHSINEKPWFGIGPGNFVDASIKYTKIVANTDSSHNLFFDLAVEEGLIGLVLFILFLVSVLLTAFKRSAKEDSDWLVFILIISQLINFQTDYSFRIYSLFLIFIILLGIVSGAEKKQDF